MATDDEVLKSIKRGDREKLTELGLSTTEIGLVYFYWYEDYVEQLKAEGRRFPGTATDIAKAAFGREEDRQHIYKNTHIKKIHDQNLQAVGQDARSTKKVEITREEALENRANRLDTTNSDLQETIDLLKEENRTLLQKVKSLESKLEDARRGRREEKAAIEHLFETGRRVML